MNRQLEGIRRLVDGKVGTIYLEWQSIGGPIDRFDSNVSLQ